MLVTIFLWWLGIGAVSMTLYFIVSRIARLFPKKHDIYRKPSTSGDPYQFLASRASR